ncbi:putative pentatricopeptide repeat-containing protein At1g12700, mitochondrial [Rosa rugosa]|uniref:putative pentatricopeptide repeat-containing protein At1g12700, mitochondrial n=1 Tax=Rosa rugosa TaxID=74645 RepID=UPI002B4011E5|nr:putative pentatricopeptide repeat-containing protein At1g12700, mitochondrial [Rosa rugosa]
MIRDYDSLNRNAIIMFNSMANHGMVHEARELFKPVTEPATLPEVAVFTFVILVYAHAGKTKAALKVYHHMLSTGVTPTAYTYTVLITAFGRDSSGFNFVGYAKKFFLEMLDKGMKPLSATYMIVLDLVAYREPVDKAKEFLEQIEAKGWLSPGSNAYQFKEGHLTDAMQVIKMYSDLVNNIVDEDVQTFFRKLRTCPGGVNKRSRKMQKALKEDGNVDESIEIFSTILQTGMEPMVLLHTSVIEAYLKFGKTKGALEAYWGMFAAGVAPNSYTYTVLIKGLTSDPNFFGDAKKCLLEMMDKGKRPNDATYTAVIEGFAKQGGKAAEEEGKEFVAVLRDKGFVPNAKAMRDVLKGRPTPVIRRVMSIVLSTLKQ